MLLVFQDCLFVYQGADLYNIQCIHTYKTTISLEYQLNFVCIFISDWQLSGIRRTDVKQADLASLMSVLIGVPFPVNSVGTVPLQVLSGTPEFQAHSLYAKARQMLQQFHVKMQQKQDTTLSALFTPFK